MSDIQIWRASNLVPFWGKMILRVVFFQTEPRVVKHFAIFNSTPTNNKRFEQLQNSKQFHLIRSKVEKILLLSR